MNSPTLFFRQSVFCVCIAVLVFCAALPAQDILGSITGTVKDATGAAVPDATVRARNAGTNLEVVQHTQANGSYSVPNIPAGTYILTFTKDGFETETHTQVLVNGEPHHHGGWRSESGHCCDDGRGDCHAADEPGRHDQWLRSGSVDD